MNHGTYCNYKFVLKRRFLSYLAFGFGAMSIAAQAMAQTVPIPPNTVNPADLPVPPHIPIWLSPSYYSLMRAPLPNLIYNPFGVPAVIPQNGSYPDSSGVLGSFQPAGATNAATNPFFQPLGTNGRGCITCHSPAAAMGLSVRDVQARYVQSQGTDPLFAPVDGATCPANVPSNMTSGSPVGGLTGWGQASNPLQGNLDVASSASPYYLLLHKGLIRIALPVPQDAEFTVSVVSDPWGCNTTWAYNQATDPASVRIPVIVIGWSSRW